MNDTARWDVVREIWKCSLGDYVTHAGLDRLDNNRFYEEVVPKGFPPRQQRYGMDSYFSALAFDAPARKNENFAGSSLLFADLDGSQPADLRLAPTYAWRTSPGMYQAVWFMNKVIMDYDEWASLNKRMTVETRADPGGWQGSKLLRVPGSANFKRAQENMIPLGEVVINNRDKLGDVDHNWLLRNLPEIKERSVRQVLADYPEPQDPKNRPLYMRSYWDKMSLRGRYMLSAEIVSDRSLHIVRTTHELLNAGLDPEVVFNLVWVQPWCKWRTDRDDPERLWEEVQLAIR